MADDGQQALVEAQESKGYAVELRDTRRPKRESFVCGLARGSLAKGYVGPTEAALRKAVAAVDCGWFTGDDCGQILDPDASAGFIRVSHRPMVRTEF